MGVDKLDKPKASCRGLKADDLTPDYLSTKTSSIKDCRVVCPDKNDLGNYCGDVENQTVVGVPVKSVKSSRRRLFGNVTELATA